MLASSIALTSKLPGVGKSIFTQMSELAHEHQAINLSQGFPDFPIDPYLSVEVSNQVAANRNQYAPSAGTLELRQAIADYFQKHHGQAYEPQNEVLVTAGATQALQSAIQALVKEGDEVIIFTPAYDCYAPLVELAGGTPVYCKLRYPDYDIEWSELKKLLNRKTKCIILNTPHNPSGKIISQTDVDELIKITEGTDIFILADEVYHNVVFDGNKHLSMSSIPKLAERSVVVGSLSKMLHVTGWKVGFCLAPKVIMKEILKVHQYTVFSVNTPVQLAIANYLGAHAATVDNAQQVYERKRNVFIQAMQGSKIGVLPCEGSYFCLIDYSQVSEADDVSFAKELVVKHKIATVPLSVFYNKPEQNKVLRVCFAKDDSILQQAAQVLHSL